MLRWLRSLGITLGLLLAVYVPTFALAAILRLPIAHAVPFIIVVSATVALILMFVLRTPLRATFADFGMRSSSKHDVAIAVALGVRLAAAVAGALSRAHEPGPLAGLTLQPLVAWLYFGLCAPLQEELIFRGLLQTVLARQPPRCGRDLSTRGRCSRGRHCATVCAGAFRRRALDRCGGARVRRTGGRAAAA